MIPPAPPQGPSGQAPPEDHEPRGPSGQAPPGDHEPPPRAPADPPAETIPWEQPGLGFVRGLVETAISSIISPVRFFGQLTPLGPAPSRPIRGVTSALSFVFWLHFPVHLLSMVLTSLQLEMRDLSVLSMAMPLYLMGLLFILSLAGITHCMIRFLHGESQPFVATIRVICFSTGAGLLAYLPVFGGLLSLGWMLGLNTLGLSTIHGCSWQRSLASLLVAYLVFIIIFIINVIFPGFIMWPFMFLLR